MTEEVWEEGTIDDWTVEECYQALGEGLVVYIQASMENGFILREVIEFMYEGVGDYIFDQLQELVTKAIELGVSFEDR
jgi:hypothetical protein